MRSGSFESVVFTSVHHPISLWENGPTERETVSLGRGPHCQVVLGPGSSGLGPKAGRSAVEHLSIWERW